MFRSSKAVADRVVPNALRRKIGPASASVAAGTDDGDVAKGPRAAGIKAALEAKKGLGPSSANSRSRNSSVPEAAHIDRSRSRGSILLRSMGKSSVNVLRTSLQEMQELHSYRWVLHPHSPFKTAWDVFSACVVIFYSWIIPFMLCFDWYEMPKHVKLFMKVLDAWGILDIILRFRTGFIEYGTVVMNPRVIRRHYVSSVWFPIDLASSIPFGYFVSNPDSESTRKTIKLIKYIKLPRLLRIGRFLKYVKGYKRYSSMTIALNTVLFVSHVAGCLWVAILNPCEAPSPNDEVYCASGHEMSVYWIAFHHGIVSLLGISSSHVEASARFLSGGYHAVNGTIPDEVYLWSSGVSVLGSILTAVLFGTVVNLVQSYNRAENAFRKKMDQVSHEMDALCLPKHLRTRVTGYYDYLWLNNRAFSEELSLLQDKGMSLTLREQIAIYLFKDYLQKIPFFQLASDSVLGMICMQLRQVIYMPDDFIIREGDIGKELFLIVKGVVRVMPPKVGEDPSPDKKILLGEGDFFGEIGVVMEVQRTRSVKAESMAELCILSRDGFDKILVEFPEFAIAMKRLIIKRVGEMWKEGDADRLEKMTALADQKMKKSVQAYRNTQKLRAKTKALQSLYPRLSKLVNKEGDAEGGPPQQEAMPASNGVGIDQGSNEAEAEHLSPIGEDEERSTPRQGAVAKNYNDHTPLRHGISAPPPINIVSEGAPTTSTSATEQLQGFQQRLDAVEQKMDERFTGLNERVSNLIGHVEGLAGFPSGSP